MTTISRPLLLALTLAAFGATAQAQPRAPTVQPRLADTALSTCDAPPENLAKYLGMQEKGMKTRAEVRADTLIWNRAGMDELFQGRQRLDTTNPVYRQRYAEYVRMRNGQEYAAELCKQLGAAG
ncbi:hypothetical protein [Achromobacter sp. UMC46]|uniref:hypothetical protein n=1 Tax=Achromobacter sp. UMC46 TaxID=1862319 RepID=UPI001C80EBF8|nr:hypothetical protein [Achromobacter sp. UMC46]